jgi:uncharacterized protein YecT (DUF1311 family)
MQTLDQHTRNAIARDEAARADAELNRVYGHLTKTWATKSSALAALKKAQLAWIAFRDAAIQQEGKAFEGGSGAEELMRWTAVRLTNERIQGLLLLLAGPRVQGEGADLTAADAFLNRLWKDTNNTEARTAQRAWLAFRDADVAVWKALGGSGKAAQARLTWERCRVLGG